MRASLLSLVGLLGLFGCADQRRVEAPSLDPEAAADRALADYDKNHDGFLDARELESCPALKGGMKRLDKDGDGRLSRDEILARLQDFADSNVGLYVTTVKVHLDGKPLAGADVTLEPEPFMCGAIKAAQGTTNDAGHAIPRTQPDVPGCQFGFYRVRISKKDSSGKELIPVRYESSLGAEVPSHGTLLFSLSK
jgi:EF hand